jgi:hypothetical protein
MNPNQVTYDVEDIGNIKMRLQHYAELAKQRETEKQEKDKKNKRRNGYGN